MYVCVINPRRACTARVTELDLCVCLSVCLSSTILALQATRRLISDTNRFSATRKLRGDFAETTAFERYGVKTVKKPICIMSTGLPRPGLARSAHRVRIKHLLRRGFCTSVLFIHCRKCHIYALCSRMTVIFK